MPFGDELAACCGFTTAFAIKTAFPCCWEVLTRVLEPNSKAAYRCYKGRLEKKFSYLVLFRWTLLLPQFHISIELQPCCLVTPYAFYPQLNVPALQFRKKQLRSKVAGKVAPSCRKWGQTKLEVMMENIKKNPQVHIWLHIKDLHQCWKQNMIIVPIFHHWNESSET